MSLYNILFGVNPIALTLLIGLELETGKLFTIGLGKLFAGRYKVYRFRDIWISKDGDRIVLLTRSGGGNRECWERLNDDECRPLISLTPEEVKAHPLYEKVITPENFNANQPPCSDCDQENCGPRFISMIRGHPHYIRDYDDDYDETYAHIEFRVPETLRPILPKLIEAQGVPKSLKEKWGELLREIVTMTPEELEADPRFRPITTALKAIAESVKKREKEE